MADPDVLVSLDEVRREVDRQLKAMDLPMKLAKIDLFMQSTDAAFRLIEEDPHQWSSRPCQTCRAISNLIGRPFGCSARSK